MQAPGGALTRFFGISARIVLTLFAVRLVVDTVQRIVYPFIPQISIGLGLSVAQFGWLISMRSWVGFAGPALGIAADRYGRKRIMLLGMIAFALGCLGVYALSGWWVIGPMLLMGLGSSAFVPTQQAYVSELAAAHRVGRALASIDMSFAMSGIFLLPLAGQMIETLGWRAPFLALAVLSGLATLLTASAFPPAARAHAQPPALASFGRVLARPNVIATLVVSGLLSYAYGSFLTVWSVWLNTAYGLNAAETGLMATAISLAELAGVVLSGLFIDRLGRRRGVGIGLVGAAAMLAVWVLVQSALLPGQAALVVLGGLLEYSIISLFPLVAQQYPEARATVFSLMGFGLAAGLALGSPLAAMLWEWQGLAAPCAVAAVALLAAAALVRTRLV